MRATDCLTLLMVVASASAGCAGMKARALRAAEPGDTERQNAALLVGSATKHMDKCEIADAKKDLEVAFAFYEGHSWIFDPGYARALIARGRLRQFSNDDAAAASDFNQAFAILGRHERENIVLLLGTSWRLADSYRDPQAQQQRRAIIERGLDLAMRRLVPLTKATPAEIEGYAEVLALIERYDSVAETPGPTAWDTTFQVTRWKWGEPWDGPSLSASSAKRPQGEPQCGPTGEGFSDANAVVQALRQDFRRCYDAALAKDATVQGAVRATTHMVADGSVRGVRGLAIGLPKECTDCVTRAIAGARFKPPLGGEATAIIPILYAVEPP